MGTNNDILLKNLLETRFFNEFRNNKDHKDSIELQITSECNLGCKYCYLHNYGDKLYPKEIRSHTTILENLNIILDWIEENNFFTPVLDIFSGEIWHTNFGIDVLDVLYQHFCKYKMSNTIMIPSNASFLINDIFKKKIEYYISIFKSIGVKLIFSLSLDGLIVEDDARPFKDCNKLGIRNQEFYDNAFEFAINHKFGFHPMVSAYSIDKWVDNYRWWCEQSDKYGLPVTNVMFLEVRNDDWTTEKIKMYLEFLRYVINYTYYNLYNQDKIEMCRNVFMLKKHDHYNNLGLHKKEDRYNCRIQERLHIRVGDLKIVPCHRTSYEQFNFGRFVVKDNKIVDIEAENIEMAIKIISGNPTYIQPKCANCKYDNFCHKGCLGSQYESMNEIFYPCRSVCNLVKAKLEFLVKKYNDMGLFDVVENSNNHDSFDYKKRVKDILELKEMIIGE